MKAVLWIIALFCLAACEQVDREALVEIKIQERIDRRISDYKKAGENRCIRELNAKALAMADSILQAQIELNPLDSLLKPPTPTKPSFPGSKRQQDSFYIKKER